MRKCPYCGGTAGFYYHFDAVDCTHRLGFDGKQLDNSEMYDNSVERRHRYAYCIDCHGKLGNASRLIREAEDD